MKTLILSILLTFPLLGKNLLFIISDDLRALQAMGDKANVSTPNLDALAAQSVEFTRCYSANPMCGPARQSIMTGLQSRHHGISNNQATHDDPIPRYPHLHRALRQRDYKTYGIGKIYHSGNGINPEGFDVTHKITNDDLTTSLAVGYLNDAVASGERFAMFVGLYEPHSPYVAPAPFGGTHDPASLVFPAGDDIPTANGYKWKFFLEDQKSPATEAERRAEAAGYYDCVTWMDHNLGLILAATPADTTIIFTSDHGLSLREHGGYAFSKRLNIEANTRVPLLIRQMGVTPRQTSKVVSHVDLYETVFDLLGLGKLPVTTDGQSIVPLLTSDNWPQHRGWAFSEIRLADNRCGGYRIHTENWCYGAVRSQYGAVLHDPVADPHGFDNLWESPSHQQTIDDLEALVPAEWKTFTTRYELESWNQSNYFDRDSDGLPNDVELILGTNLTSAEPAGSNGLQVVHLTAVSFYLAPNESRSLEVSSDLSNWTSIGTFTGGSGGELYEVELPSSPSSFFRLE